MRNETRVAKRRRTNCAGIVRAGQKEFTVLLRDLSPTGARVRVVSVGELPERVQLVAPMVRIDSHCIVVWRRGNDYGLHFQAPQPH
ncbi:PilZ domain-containing protein [Hyphomicrobium sp.]|uniref:PilZ domain-containing protein n=1 Tax=Hyphomicrobium sp. TaxID=82 RepID=UPI0039C8BDC6